MTMKRNLLWLAMTSLVLPVSVAHADDDSVFYNNHIELGVGHTSDDNGKLGEFGDELDEGGTFGVGSISLNGGADDGSYQTSLNLDKDPYNTTGSIGYVRPGSLKVELYGADSQKIEKFDVMTDWPNTGDSTYFNFDDRGAVGSRTFRVDRDAYGIAITKYLTSEWSISADYKHEKKDGHKTLGDGYGVTSSILPAVVDYEHDQFSMGIEYSGNGLVLGASYYLSDFSNAEELIETDGFYRGQPASGELALEPDNEFERFELDGLYQLGDRTVLSWIVNWSSSEQNEDTIGTDANFPTGLKFDGEVERFNGRLTLTSRPTRNFSYKLEYALRDREADHDPIELAYRRDTKVFDKEQDTIKASGSYRFANRSKLRFGYERDDIERTSKTTDDYGMFGGGDFTNVTSETEEDTFWAEYKFAPLGNLNLSVKAEASDRSGNQAQFPEWISPYDADRDRSKYSVNASFLLSEKAVVSARFSRTDDEYDVGDYVVLEGGSVRDPYGIKSRDWYSAYVDLTLTPSEDLSFSIYVMRETFDWERFGWERAKPNDIEPSGSYAINSFIYESEDETDAYGINLNWQACDDLRIEADLSVAESGSQLSSYHYAGYEAGSTFNQPGYDDDNTRLNVLATYQVNPEWSVYARYIYEDWDVEDPLAEGFLFDGFAWDANDGSNNAFIAGVRKSF